MADVLGTTVGVISLTIQLYDKFSKLVDDYNTRDEQVSKLLHRLLSISNSLRNIESAAADFEQKHPQASHEVSAQVRACHGELKELQTLVHKFIPAAGASVAKGKTKEAAKKLKFSLARETIDKLDSRLVGAESALSVAMACLQLHTQSGMASQIADIKSGQDDQAQTVHGEFRGLGARIDKLQTASSVLGGVSDDVRDIKTALPAMSDETRAMMLSQKEEISKLVATLESVQVQLEHLKPENRGMALVSRTVSKPALQRELCDQFRTVERLSRHHAQGERTSMIRPLDAQSSGLCRCGARRRQYSRTTTLWLSLSWLETVDEIHHSPKCPKFQTEDNRFKGVMFTGLRRHLSVALSVGWAMNHGAGAFSMAPTVRYNCMVDSEQSPLFQLVDAVFKAQTCWGMSEKGASEVADHAILILRRMLSSRKVSVADINQHGATALTQYWSRVRIYAGTQQATTTRMIDALMELGFPTQGVGSDWCVGPIVTDIVFPSRGQVVTSETWARLVESSRNDFLVTREGRLDHFHKISVNAYAHWYRLVRDYRDVSGVLGLDSPLAEALIEQDEPSLHALIPQLQASPSMLNENGISLLLFACNWPSGLRILVESCLHVVTPDMSRFAFEISRYLCEQADANTICSEECHCAKSLQVFLDAGVCFDIASLFQEASVRATLGILSYLKGWRDWLKELAMSVLSDKEQHNFIDSTVVLDSQATQAIESIERRGMSVCEASGLDFEDSRLGFPDGRSIYHYIRHAEHARLAFDLGFMDIDVADKKGVTPLMSFVDSGLFYKEGPQFLLWLISHGVNYSAPMHYMLGLSNNEELPPAHTIAHCISYYMPVHLLWCGPYPDELDKIACAVSIGDGCCCGCADPIIGCTPSLVFVKLKSSLWRDGYFAILSDFLEVIDPVLDLVRPHELIRLLTFEALELRHTCCRQYNSDPWKWTERVRDFNELREEDSTRLEELEILVDEFAYLFQNYPLGLVMFILTVWTDHMAEEVEYTDRDSELSDEQDVEYWMEKLDKIEAGQL